MKTQDTRTFSPSAQEALRRRVVEAVINQGMSITAAAQTFHVSRTSVHAWLTAYRNSGQTALRSGKRGRKPGNYRLLGWQAATIAKLIVDRCPDQLKLPFVLWTRQAVQQLIAERYGVHLAIRTVGNYLKRWGFTPQKPVRRAYERDPEAVKRWLKEEYPQIAKRAKAENARILWEDEMGLRSDHQTGSSYGRRGRTPVVPGTGQRFGCNMVSAISNQGELSFMVFKERFTSKLLIEFMGRLVRQADGRKIFLILDGQPVHRAKMVKQWVAKREDLIELILLPSYSPDLNPDELLNQDVKSNAVGRCRAKDQANLIADVRGYLRSTQRKPQIVQNYFLHPDVQYAAGKNIIKCSTI